MMYLGKPIAEMNEAELDYAAADLFIRQGLKNWAGFFILLATRFWVQRRRAMPPTPRSLRDLLSWESVLRGVDRVTDRALTRLYFVLFPRPHSSRIMGIIMEAIEIPVGPWGVEKPAYGDKLFRWK